MKVLEQSNISSNDYDSTKLPFFSSDSSLNNFTLNFQSLSNYNIPESLNRNIVLIYKILGHPDKEIYIYWKFDYFISQKSFKYISRFL